MQSQYRGSHQGIQSLVEPSVMWCTDLKRTYGFCTEAVPTYIGTWPGDAQMLANAI